MSLLERLANQQEFANMTMNDKLLATLYVAILGMGITFLVLIFLQYCIKFMSWMLKWNSRKEAVTVQESNVTLERPIHPEWKPEQDENEEELIAVITAAVVACMSCPADGVVVRNIRRIHGGAPSWAKAGLADQMTVRKSY